MDNLSNSKPHHILYVTPRYLPFTGGVENHVYQVAHRLAAQGIAVTVLTTDPGGKLPAKEVVEGVTIERVRAWPARRDYYFAPGIYQRIRQGQWDIVHLQSYHTLVAPLAMVAAWRSKIPYIVTFHGGGHSSHLRNALRRVQWAILRPLLARAVSLVAVARFEIEFYAEKLYLLESKFSFIPNGCDLPQVDVPPLNSADSQPLVVSLGRLERYKGHDKVIKALPELLKNKPGARLWIAGSGPYEVNLRQLAMKLGISDRVEIRAIPANDRQTMALELSKAALVTLLSEYETQPIAVLEAVGLGRPVLVADNSGMKELAEQGLARSIPLKSTPIQIAQAMLEQMEQPVMKELPALTTWDDCTAKLLHLYLTVLERPLCA